MNLKNFLKLSVCLMTINAFGQDISLKEKREVLDKLTTAIEDNYVLQDSVPYIKSNLKKIAKSDDFRKDQSLDDFGNYLTLSLRTITKDAHFAVRHDSMLFQTALAIQAGEGIGQRRVSPGGSGLPDTFINYYFKRLEVLSGNVGYLKIEQMPLLQNARATVDASMTFLENTDALIIDLRQNPGGIGGFIPYLMSYFFPPDSTLLYSREFGAWDSVSYHYTHKTLGANRYGDKPVYILIDRFTGSAATNMAYTMQSFGRATLIGENTGQGYRGAHSATIFPLGNNMVALVPIARVINSVTKTNWREEGVIADVQTSSEDALNSAYKLTLEDLLASSADPSINQEINKAISDLEETIMKSKEMVVQDLSEYRGQFGDATITYENGKLYTKRPQVPIKLELQRKEGDLFKIIIPPGARGNVPDLRFNRENGKVVSVTTIRDGVEERTDLKQ